jgi:hypothetical protein
MTWGDLEIGAGTAGAEAASTGATAPLGARTLRTGGCASPGDEGGAATGAAATRGEGATGGAGAGTAGAGSAAWSAPPHTAQNLYVPGFEAPQTLHVGVAGAAAGATGGAAASAGPNEKLGASGRLRRGEPSTDGGGTEVGAEMAGLGGGVTLRSIPRGGVPPGPAIAGGGPPGVVLATPADPAGGEPPGAALRRLPQS